MKKSTAILGALAAVGIIGAGTTNSDACGLGEQDFKTTSNLNLRVAPDKDSQRITTMPKGTIVVPDEISKKDPEWVKVEFGNKEGWASRNYMQMLDCTCGSPEEGLPTSTFSPKKVVAAKNIVLRSQPNLNASTQGNLKAGTVLMASKIVGAWAYVEDGHIDGWVHTPNLKEYVEKPSIDVTYFKGYVKANALNLRADRNTNSRILATLPKGQKLDIKHETNGWLKVETKLNGKILRGYVSAEYVG